MDFSVITDNLPRFASGAWVTLQLTALSMLIGLVLAVPVALARLSHNPLLSWPAFAYMFFFRGTPLLVQIFLIYYGSGQFVRELRSLGLWQFFREPYFCAVLTLTLNTAAYTAEILRGAIRAVPFGEVEAGRAFGMSVGLSCAGSSCPRPSASPCRPTPTRSSFCSRRPRWCRSSPSWT